MSLGSTRAAWAGGESVETLGRDLAHELAGLVSNLEQLPLIPHAALKKVRDVPTRRVWRAGPQCINEDVTAPRFGGDAEPASAGVPNVVRQPEQVVDARVKRDFGA